MKKKKMDYGITFNKKTFFVLKQTKDGILQKLPQLLPDCHFTYLFEGGKLGIHPTNETKVNGNRYDNENRFEIDFNKINVENFEENFKDMMVKIKKHELTISMLPGRAYLGGYFQLSENAEALIKSGGKYREPMEDLWEKLYIIRKDQMTFYKENIWIVLNRGGGIKGKWYDTGIVLGPFEWRFFYFPYNDFEEIYSGLYPNIPKMDLFMDSKINILLPFGDKVKNILMERGKKIVEET